VSLGTRQQAHRATDHEILELERVAAAAWPPPEQEWSPCGALLRAADGWTGRANSALVLDAPSDLRKFTTGVVDWYRQRDLTPAVAVPFPVHEFVSEGLRAQGWSSRVLVPVLTAAAETALDRLGPRDDLPPVDIADEPDPAWLSVYRPEGLPPVAYEVLRGGGPAFGSVTIDGQPVAVGRVTVTEGWAGLTAIEVLPSMRRRGLGAHIVRELIRWAADHGAYRVWLQVGPENEPALRLYDQAGLSEHNDYHVLRAPVDGQREPGI